MVVTVIGKDKLEGKSNKTGKNLNATAVIQQVLSQNNLSPQKLLSYPH